ncbi:MAG: translocation/assembly module TamB [Muribaculaceae bacterium]|nr:translocation/assembly module TamB [Muribaculaceae bacterium]
MKEDDDKTAPESNASEAKETAKTGKRHMIKPRWLRIILKTFFWIIVSLLLVPVLLYVPPVQTFVKNVACDMVYKSTGMRVDIGKFRLKWPVDVSLQGVTVLEASGDTMVNAREVIADVKLMPLFKLDVKVNRLRLLDGYYRMVSPDSSMILKINAGLLDVDDKSSVDIASSRILINKAYLRGGNVSLFMNVWKQKPTPTDSASTPFFIKAADLRLEDFGFEMSMLPTIDTLRFNTSTLTIREGVVDLGKNLVTASSLAASDGSMTYLTPTPEYISGHPAPLPDSTSVATPSVPMVIKGDTVSLSGFKALYAVKDAVPADGFDPSYIEVEDVAVSLENFYNASSTVELPVASIKAKERSGLQITEGHGTVSVDSTGLALKGLEISTPYSSLSATAGIPFALMQLNPDAPLNAHASGSVGLPDVEAFMPALKVYTKGLPRRNPLRFGLEAEGTLSDVDIPTFEMSMQGVFDIKAEGKAENALDYKKLRGALDFEGAVVNPGVIDNLLGKVGFKLPQMHIKGRASAAAQTYAANFRLDTSAGDVAADGKVSMTAESYDADVDLRNVNVAHFMPALGVGEVTASVSAHGAGFNPTKPHAVTDVRLDVASLVYQKKTLRNIVADIGLHDGAYTITALSSNEDADFRVDGSGTLAPDFYTFDLTGRLNRLDLHSLGLTPEANAGSGSLYITGTASPERWLYDVDMRLDSVEWTVGNQYFNFPGDVAVRFDSYADNVAASVEAELMSLDFNSRSGLKRLVGSFMEVGDSVGRQISRRDLNVEGLQAALPPFEIGFNASGRGIVGRYLNTMGLSVDTVYANIANDSLITAKAGIYEAGNKSMRADTLTLAIRQRGNLLDYKAHMGNRRNNSLAEFADVNVNGYLGANRILISLTQKNQKGETGYRLGLTGALADSIATVHFTPLKATIAYLPWTFNEDNHVEYNFADRHIDANLIAESNESSVKLVTQLGKAGNDELRVAIHNLRVQDFLKMSVFAPPLTASVDADLNVGYTQNWLYGGGTLGIKDFTYDKIRVGNLDLSLKAGRNNDGTSGAGATLKVDGNDALTAKMWLKPDSTGVLQAEKFGIELTRFPLYIANAFIGNDVARLSGYLNGDIDMKGSFSAPLLNGTLACDSVGVFVPMIGSQLKFADDSLTVADNIIRLSRFDIWGANNNPLVIDGSVDATRFSAISFDIGVKGKNFQLINNDKKARSDIYGKIFLDLDASARGPMDHFNVNANVNVLSATDVTYSVPQTTAQLTEQSMEGVVKFVNFNDTTQVLSADTVAPSMTMRIVADLTIEPGTEVEVIYPGTQATGSGKGVLHPSGNLNYFQNYMGDMRLNGQLNLGEGYANYNVPMLGNKKFEFNPASYIRWSGDIMNPALSIEASDHIKANLLQNGNSRIVNFLVSLSVKNNLSQPKLLFDLSTEDDMSIQNDLLSMSADQRSMAAINLLLTGQYNQQGVKTASADFLSSSMLTEKLYGVLTSSLNNFLANNVKGVELSFGVDQYDKTVNGESGTAMSYSYQMSKSLFNNRFKISVGGNYTTDASADENFSENLISDISFEYILKQTSNVTMLARLFRHTGYESILEGEITETGVGFVMRRRLSDLRDLFRWGTRNNDTGEPSDSTTVEKPDSAMVIKNDTIPQIVEEHEERKDSL